MVACDTAPVTSTKMPATLAFTSTLTQTPLPSSTRSPIITPKTEFDQAREALFIFFDSLYREDYQTAAHYFHGYKTLQESFLQMKTDEFTEILREACNSQESCRFFCWPVKEIVEEKVGALGTYVVVLSFEKNGVLLEGGDNRAPTPCEAGECPRTKYTYTVSKIDGRSQVNETPVFSSCYP